MSTDKRLLDFYCNYAFRYGFLFMLVSGSVAMFKSINYENAKLYFAVAEMFVVVINIVYIVLAIRTLKFKNILIYNLVTAAHFGFLILDLHFQNVGFLFYFMLSGLTFTFIVVNAVCFKYTVGKVL